MRREDSPGVSVDSVPGVTWRVPVRWSSSRSQPAGPTTTIWAITAPGWSARGGSGVHRHAVTSAAGHVNEVLNVVGSARATTGDVGRSQADPGSAACPETCPAFGPIKDREFSRCSASTQPHLRGPSRGTCNRRIDAHDVPRPPHSASPATGHATLNPTISGSVGRLTQGGSASSHLVLQKAGGVFGATAGDDADGRCQPTRRV